MQQTEQTKKWWNNAIFYQVYPKSFLDTNGDGIGDIRGIIEKLDYIEYLGINAIWVSPVYQSPMKDNGYDISDYYDIHPDFGTITDMKELIRKAKDRGISIIMDLVVNHCSDQHVWFQEAMADPASPYREYFTIRKGVDGREPNNWRGVFGGSVWERIGDSDEYYYHTFTKEQPDLNWENPAMRKEIYDMMNYWLDLGIRGFRIDAITFIKKDLTFRSLPADGPDGLAGLAEVSENYPGIEDFLMEMKNATYGRYDAFSVAEISRPSDEMVTKFIGANGVFDSIFDFSYLDMDVVDGKWFKTHKITAPEIKETMFQAQEQAQRVGGYYSTVLQNHDQNRALSKYFDEEDICFESATMLATLNLTLRGVPFLYQGEEIGMTNRKWQSWHEIDDVSTYGQYQMALDEGIDEAEAFRLVTKRSRDNARTPMQWSDQNEAGFTTGKPWIPANENYRDVNVKAQMADSGSVLQHYRRLIELRRSKRYGDLLSQGALTRIDLADEAVIAYQRHQGDKQLTVILNYDNKVKTVAVPGFDKCDIVLSNYSDASAAEMLTLRPYEAIIAGV